MTIPDIGSILRRRLKGNVVAVGVGNRELRDDGAGVSLVESLVPSGSFKPFPAGDSPEFHISEILEEDPDVVMFVDTADLQSPPGSVAVIERGQLPTGWGNTHQPPLSVIMEYVSAETGADTFLLGIQPEDVSAGNRLSPSGSRTVEILSDLINEIAAIHEKPLRGEKT
jgi:hydrogenase 3 maturation protease